MRPSRILLLLAALAIPLLFPAPVNAAPAIKYVARGDSYASGPSLATQVAPECERSDHNYPHLLAAALGVRSFADASCGGATTAAFTSSQKSGVPPQFDMLAPDTDLVTVTIGGNDAGILTDLGTCGVLALGEWWSNPRQKHFISGGVDQIETKIAAAAGKVGQAIRDIRARAPHATIVVAGYLRLVPDGGGCWPWLPFAPGDVPWVTAKQQSLDAMLQTQAEVNGALAVNPYQASTGHDACKPVGVRWTEPTLGTHYGPAHPNVDGMTAMANLIKAKLAM
ncbi:SGNH/GDSL hydrolase family protein [Streptosporangium amethystogenes]|uniref:SGNH/GDSL hydrolase family protein n=1 Tax=Streptosporangium amethystogenes TaxID=2002 RepID=UPI0004C5F76B|nr:SGNH/GDSL hydrolase family protein [Streptosporangium amethystogenes]